MPTTQRQFVLAELPRDKLSDANFRLEEAPIPAPAEGEALLRTLYISLDAANRAWMQGATYRSALEGGQVMAGGALAEVVESRSPNLKPGDLVFADTGWREYAALKAKNLQRLPRREPLTHLLSVYGITGLTAYFGLLECGQPKPGETVVVSAAAGAVGSIVGQIAKLKGCRTVGVAGGEAKCALIQREFGYDAAVDYKAGGIGRALREACPDGINVYFDNTGGDILEACLFNMALHGRIACCGAVSQYDGAAPAHGPRGVPGLIVVKRLTLRGFVLYDFMDRQEAALDELESWVEAGKIKVREDVIDGFEHLPAALIGLLAGENIGKRMVKVGGGKGGVEERKTALITGVTGQDGAYLARLLLEKGYVVHGIKRRSSSFNTARVDDIFQDPHDPDPRFVLHFGDMTDATNLIRIVQQVRPDEIYNLAAQSHVQVSFETAEYTANADALGPLRLLEAIRLLGLGASCRFYQASTSELFGNSPPPQSETTPFAPRSPYGAAKLFAYWAVVNYREAYGLHASNGILFNHESPLRGETFVTRKITRGVAAIATGKQDGLWLGNLNAVRDWGHARDYAAGMWAMLQQDEPGDYVLATGEAHTVREFAEAAFAEIGVSLAWRGEGRDEVGFDAATGAERVRVDPRYFRPTEVDALLGDASKARAAFGWTPQTGFRALVAEMVAADLAEARR